MELPVILSTFSLLFLAEMGDKSQLLAMTLAHRYPVGPVILGTFAAFALLSLLAVFVGQALLEWVSRELVLTLAGGLFLLFAYRSWRSARQKEEELASQRSGNGALLASFTMILFAEFGDKTQLATIGLVCGTGQIWSVLIGSILALWTVSLLGILFGATLLRRVPKPWMHRAAALLFATFGLLALGEVVLLGRGMGGA